MVLSYSRKIVALENVRGATFNVNVGHRGYGKNTYRYQVPHTAQHRQRVLPARLIHSFAAMGLPVSITRYYSGQALQIKEGCIGLRSNFVPLLSCTRGIYRTQDPQILVRLRKAVALS